jgi:hypothetical protein
MYQGDTLVTDNLIHGLMVFDILDVVISNIRLQHHIEVGILSNLLLALFR